MSGTKFTPGPWKSEWAYGVGNEPLYLTVRQVEGNYRGDAAQVHQAENIGGITREEMIANAHLIAAAPELYEAVMAIIAWDDSEESGPDYGTLTRDTHPDGESIWREWYDRNLASCERAFKLAHKSASKALGES